MRRFWLCYMPVVIFLLAVFYIVTPRDLTASNLLLSSSQMQILKGSISTPFHKCEANVSNGCSTEGCNANNGYQDKDPYSVEKCVWHWNPLKWCNDSDTDLGIQPYCLIVQYQTDCDTVINTYDENVAVCVD